MQLTLHSKTKHLILTYPTPADRRLRVDTDESDEVRVKLLHGT